MNNINNINNYKQTINNLNDYINNQLIVQKLNDLINKLIQVINENKTSPNNNKKYKLNNITSLISSNFSMLNSP